MFTHLVALLALTGTCFAALPQEDVASDRSKPSVMSTLELTGRDLDLGLEGDGYYRLDVGNGEFRYTRDGRFTTNGNGDLIASTGFKLSPPINIGIGARRIMISSRGIVEVLYDGSKQTQRRGQILLTFFTRPEQLEQLGAGLHWAPDSAGAPEYFVPGEATTAIRQGYLERAGEPDPQEWGSVTITLAMEAHANGTEVELGEIAQIVGASDALVQTVKAIELGYSPAPGYSRLFRADRISAQLKKEIPLADIRFAGQRAVRVYPSVAQISSEEIMRAAQAGLAKRFAADQMSFAPRTAATDIAVPMASVKRELRARVEAKPDASGILSVPVDVLVDGVRYQTVWTTWEVTVYQTRPVLARRVRAGEILRPDMFVRRRVEVKQGDKHGLSGSLLTGAVALHDLLPGQLVTPLDVRRPVVVQLGEAIFLRVKNGPIEAKVSAIALEAGAVGDRIRVRTADGAQELVATIDSRDTCTINLSK